jgi:hypothetical protein
VKVKFQKRLALLHSENIVRPRSSLLRYGRTSSPRSTPPYHHSRQNAAANPVDVTDT